MFNQNSNSLYRDDGINKNTYDLLFQDYDNINENEMMKREVLDAWLALQKYTMLQHKKILFKLTKFVLKNKGINLDDIKYSDENNEFIYEHDGIKYNFDILSNYVDDLDKVKELQSNKRYGWCHTKSVAIAANMNDAKIISGYAITGNLKYLHSIIVKKNSKGVIEAIDWTQNIIMPYDQYKSINQFEELAEVNSEVIKDDLNKVIIGMSLGIKPYLFFRNELMNDTKRNEEIFYKR